YVDASAVGLECPGNAVFERYGIVTAPRAGQVVIGEGVVKAQGATFTVTRMTVLFDPAMDPKPPAARPSSEAIRARDKPYAAWLPRWLRIDTNLQNLRGPVTNLRFEFRGVVKTVSAAEGYSQDSAPPSVPAQVPLM